MVEQYESKPHKPKRGEVKLQCIGTWNRDLKVLLALPWSQQQHGSK